MTAKQEIQEMAAEHLLRQINSTIDMLESYTHNRARLYSKSNCKISAKIGKLRSVSLRLSTAIVIHTDNGLRVGEHGYESYLAE